MARLEICVDSYESAVNAISGGANQLEVCGALTLGGLTPSVGLVRRLRSSFPQTPLFIMLRPRDGDFLYTTDEVEVMLEDLRAMKTLGVGGFVFGALGRDGGLEENTCNRLLSAARPLPSTLHRVFDLTKDWRTALNQAVKMGFNAILTSGQADTAVEGSDRLRKICAEAADRIHIIAGSGVNSKTLPFLMSETGCWWYHGSASVDIKPEISRNRIAMGSKDGSVRRLTSKDEVSAMKQQMEAFFGSQPLPKRYY